MYFPVRLWAAWRNRGMSTNTQELTQADAIHFLQKVSGEIGAALYQLPEGMPSGELYALLSSVGMPLKIYAQIITIMLEVRAIRQEGDRLFYAGPISQPSPKPMMLSVALRPKPEEACEKCDGAGPLYWSDDFDGAICEGCH
jgi:hypothetical protein